MLPLTSPKISVNKAMVKIRLLVGDGVRVMPSWASVLTLHGIEDFLCSVEGVIHGSFLDVEDMHFECCVSLKPSVSKGNW